MHWSDEAIIIAKRPYGETGSIVEAFTRERGRHFGFTYIGRANRGAIQQGAHVKLEWRGRLPEQMGRFRIEPISDTIYAALHDRGTLSALNSFCSLCSDLLPEGHAYARLYQQSLELITGLDNSKIWPSAYARWEYILLSELGYGLNLSTCAATGDNKDLLYVSPKTGRAISRKMGEPYADKLLPLPEFMLNENEEIKTMAELDQALTLTGYFIARHACQNNMLPAARTRFAQWCKQIAYKG